MRWNVYLCVFLIVAGTAGCAIESRQLNALQSLFYEQSTAPETGRWDAFFMGQRTAMQALIGERKILFVSDQSDYVEFDGWSIRQVGGFGRFNKALRILDTDGERRFVVEGRIRAINQCLPWARRETADEVMFEQACKGAQAYTNTILVDSLGRIIRIEQYTGEGASAFILQLIE